MGKRKKFRIKNIMRIIAVLAAVVCAYFIYVFGVASTISAPVMFSVPAGASVSSVATDLQKSGIIKSPKVFKFSVKLNGGRVMRGEYEIPAHASTWRVVQMLTRGDIATTTIVIPEGLTIKQIRELLLNSSQLTGPATCDDARAVCNLKDGDVFPDTYRVARGTSRIAVLDLARKHMDAIKESWVRGGRRTPYPLRDWSDIITLASIVQRETPRASEMPLVASVYLNRLRQNMRLQADPTVVYAITDGHGDMRGKPLLRDHLKTDSPYNTYTNRGLPPTPIANVGRSAISAVLNPADTEFLYFVADGRGGHRFSKSYDQHQKNRNAWRAIKNAKNNN